MQVNGPEVPLQVVVCPEQVQEAGQVVSIVMLVTVMVLLEYGTDVVGAEEVELDDEVEEVGEEVGLDIEVGQGS